MKTTQEFKVGDIVRFKLEDEHQEYATRWDFPTFGLKISKIERAIAEDSNNCLLIYVEGQENFSTSAVYDHRLEKQPTNMFAFGKKNPKIKKLFLDYIKGHRNSGLCWHTEEKSDKAHDFLKLQKVFEVNAATPVEYFILRSKKKSTKNAWYNYTNTYRFNDPSTPEGRLRIWWATNLAIAASQGKI